MDNQKNIKLKEVEDSVIAKTKRQRDIIASLNRTPKDITDYLANLSKVLDLFDFTSLRPHQNDPVLSLFNGNDVLYVVPTSGGKSFVYITAALSMGLKTVIFSPLISLIQNQADILRDKGLKVGVISSAVTPRERSLAIALWERQELDFLFIAPERLTSESFMDSMRAVPPDFVVVDEIHCASQYGDNFRPAYKKIAPFVAELKPKLFLGLTATMSQDVETDIRAIFNMPDTQKICKAYKRENLHFTSVELSPELADARVYQEINKRNSEGELPQCIVYCSTVNKVIQLYNTYGKSIRGGAMMYHGQMSTQDRESNQTNFLSGKIRVAFATNSFGMGVDAPKIQKVIFRTIPGTIEELIQGFGRGGRSGCDCDCLLIGDRSTINTQEFFIDMGYPSKYAITSFYKALTHLADKEDNTVSYSLKDICDRAGIDTMYAGAVVQILTGFNVIKRSNTKPAAKIRFKDLPKESDKIIEKFKKYANKIDLIGMESGDGFITVDMDFLAEEMGLTKATCVKTIKNFSELGFLTYQAPLSAPPIEIIGSLDLVDFNYLAEKRLEKERKLAEVIGYLSIPDDKKSDYLDDYFTLINHA